MTTILIVEKSGNIKESIIKTYSPSELYKKAGYKTDEDFTLFTTWNVSLEDKKYNISLFGKTTGRANNENKYDFPPPADTELFFGNCILVNHNDNNKCIHLTVEEWEKIYEYLFGGFEGLDNGEDDIEDEDEFEGLPTTKVGGYLKDGFVIDDDDLNDDQNDDDDDEYDQSEDEIRLKVAKKKDSSKKSLLNEVVAENAFVETYLDCKSELSEESYFSD